MSFRSVVTRLCVFAVLAPGWALAVQFTVPQGWVDLSPSAPAPNFDRLPADRAQLLKNAGFAAMAMDLDHPPSSGFTSNFNAILRPDASVVDESFLSQMAVQLPQDVRKSDPAAVYRVVERAILKVDRVPSGRLVAEGTLGGVRVKQLVYLLPVGREMAVVTYSAAPDVFDRDVTLFDATISQTTGLKNRPLALRVATLMDAPEWAGWLALLGPAVLFLGAILLKWTGRRRRTSDF